MLDALRGPCALDDVRALSQRGVGVAAAYDRAGELIGVQRIDLRRPLAEGRRRTQHGLERLVLDANQRHGLTRGVLVLGGHRGQEVAHTTRLFALGHEARPVIQYQPVPALARHVLGRRHAADARQGFGRAGIDAQHLGPRVRGEQHRGVQHARAHQIGHVGPAAEGQLGAAVTPERLPDPTVDAWLGQHSRALGARQELDRIDDLGVARAAAQVHVDRLGDLVARRVRVALDEMVRAQRDARVQNPHWTPAAATKERASMSFSPCGSPSSVVTSLPATFSAGIAQVTTARPPTSARQAPHCPCGLQPSLVETIPQRSRRTSSSDSPSLAWTWTSLPLSVNCREVMGAGILSAVGPAASARVGPRTIRARPIGELVPNPRPRGPPLAGPRGDHRAGPPPRTLPDSTRRSRPAGRPTD